MPFGRGGPQWCATPRREGGVHSIWPGGVELVFLSLAHGQRDVVIHRHSQGGRRQAAVKKRLEHDDIDAAFHPTESAKHPVTLELAVHDGHESAHLARRKAWNRAAPARRPDLGFIGMTKHRLLVEANIHIEPMTNDANKPSGYGLTPITGRCGAPDRPSRLGQSGKSPCITDALVQPEAGNLQVAILARKPSTGPDMKAQCRWCAPAWWVR